MGVSKEDAQQHVKGRMVNTKMFILETEFWAIQYWKCVLFEVHRNSKDMHITDVDVSMAAKRVTMQ
jgi:hypothetical protein